jgi:hypothetical protein
MLALNFKKLSLTAATCLAVAAPFSNALADGQLPIIQKHIIPNAVTLNVTPSGMKYLENKLGYILGNVGISFDEGVFDPVSFDFKQSIKEEDLQKSSPEMAKLIYSIRGMLTKWLTGFSLSDHKPAIRIGASKYFAEFNRFALVTDQALMDKLGKKDGAVLAIELNVRNLNLETQYIKAWDLNNEFLGQVGLENLKINLGSKEKPVQLRLPFYVRINEMGLLEFEALQVDTNIKSVPSSIEDINKIKLLTPSIALEINGKRYAINTSEIDKVAKAQLPEVLAKLQNYLQDFATTQLPELLNKKVAEVAKGYLEQTQSMVAPGASPDDTRPPLTWGLRLMGINQKTALNVNLGGFVADPLNVNSKPQPKDFSRGLPNLSAVPTSAYDVALTVDRGLVNRILQLSYERKNFEKIALSDGSFLKLTAAPKLDYVAAPAGAAINSQETFIKLRLSIEQKPGSFFLKDTIEIAFDLLAKLRPIKDKSGLQIVLHSIDLDSTEIDPKYLSWAGKMLAGKVRSEIKKELAKKSAAWGAGNDVIPGSLPLPPEVLGISFVTHQLSMDKNGHLVMYLKYSPKAVLNRASLVK